LDILFINGETGTLELFEAKLRDEAQWFPNRKDVVDIVRRLMFPVTGSYMLTDEDAVDTLIYEPCHDSELLHALEDPLAAIFFDMDEGGRQDILVTQAHGTRLIWNNYQQVKDSVFFKATGLHSAEDRSSSRSQSKGLSPLPGTTFMVAYGGRRGKEVQVCSQCPQTGFLSLQACSCFFGITRVANYIEEMAMGGAGGVRAWNNLMPNALAIVWPQRNSLGGASGWKVAYLAKGRDGQMQRIVIVLCATLVVLFFAIVYIHGVEKLELDASKFDIAYT